MLSVAVNQNRVPDFVHARNKGEAFNRFVIWKFIKAEQEVRGFKHFAADAFSAVSQTGICYDCGKAGIAASLGLLDQIIKFILGNAFSVLCKVMSQNVMAFPFVWVGKPYGSVKSPGAG